METYYTAYTKLLDFKTYYFVKKFSVFPELKDVPPFMESYGMHTDFNRAPGFPQVRKDGYVEEPIITSGDDLVAVGQFLKEGKTSYTAEDVVRYLLGPFMNVGQATA